MSIDTTFTARRYTGELILRSHDGYENARTARIYHSLHPERFGAAVLLAQTEQDVSKGYDWPVKGGWKVGIKSGGPQLPMLGTARRQPSDRYCRTLNRHLHS